MLMDLILSLIMLESTITESTPSKQEKIKLASDHQNAADFQTSMKESQHLIIKLTSELAVELTPELAVELIPKLITELISELNTELFTALNHEMDPEIEISGPEAAANDNHLSSFTTTMLKLRGYVEREHPTGGGDRLIMPHASIWWWWSGDAALRYKPYLRDGSVAGRTRGPFLHLMISFGPSLIFMQWLRIEVIISVIISAIISAIISVIIWGLSVVNRHGDEMTGPATPKQCGKDGIRSPCSEMSSD
jgi:hypothetical protein